MSRSRLCEGRGGAADGGRGTAVWTDVVYCGTDRRTRGPDMLRSAQLAALLVAVHALRNYLYPSRHARDPAGAVLTSRCVTETEVRVADEGPALLVVNVTSSLSAAAGMLDNGTYDRYRPAALPPSLPNLQ